MASGQASWDSFKIQLPGKDFLEPVRNVLETLVVFLEVLKAILETVKVFLIDISNPISALVAALIELITTFFAALNRTGIYAWFDAPDPTRDPNFFRFHGGFPAFVNRFKGSLLDTRDPNRPQPIAGATMSGFVAIVADAQGPIELLRLFKILMKFFQKELHPRYPAPSNVKILPIGDKGAPLLRLAQVFGSGVKGVTLNWSLGSQIASPDPGFNDLGATVGSEFIPPSWIIEKSSVPVTNKIKADQLTSANVAGVVVMDVETDHEVRGQPNKRAKQTVRVVDESGDPIIRFEKVITVTTGNGILDAVVGELGTFKWIDTDVELDKTYYYRIRAYSGDLPITNGVIQYNKPVQDIKTKRWMAPLPDGVVLGRPSPVFRIHVPKLPPNFDVVDNLKRLFLTAFSLNFHLDLPAGAVFNASDDPANSTTTVVEIGQGSLARQAGVLSAFEANPLAGKVLGGADVSRLTTSFQVPVDPGTSLPLPPPWGQPLVTHQANRLAGIVASALLEQGSGAIDQFVALMRTYPRGVPTAQGKLTTAKNVSEMCFALTYLTPQADPFSSALSKSVTDSDTYTTWGNAFTDPVVRKNVLTVVRYILSFTLGGTPPDWIQVSVLRDIIPWSGQLLYDILAKIQALLDAFKSVLDEVKNFIDMIERKIDVLERFIQFLISILDFILSLEAGFYILKLPETDGDVFDWMAAIDTASGTPPPSGPGGYSAGVVFAYIALNVQPFADAFSLIF